MNEADETLVDHLLGGNDKPRECGAIGHQAATVQTHFVVRTSHLRSPELLSDESLVSKFRDSFGLTAPVQLDP